MSLANGEIFTSSSGTGSQSANFLGWKGKCQPWYTIILKIQNGVTFSKRKNGSVFKVSSKKGEKKSSENKLHVNIQNAESFFAPAPHSTFESGWKVQTSTSWRF